MKKVLALALVLAPLTAGAVMASSGAVAKTKAPAITCEADGVAVCPKETIVLAGLRVRF